MDTQRYINNIIAQCFGLHEVARSEGQLTETGWYWADSQDNYRYSDWSGPFATSQDAIDAGIEYRKNIIKQFTKEGFLK